MTDLSKLIEVCDGEETFYFFLDEINKGLKKAGIDYNQELREERMKTAGAEFYRSEWLGQKELASEAVKYANESEMELRDLKTNVAALVESRDALRAMFQAWMTRGPHATYDSYAVEQAILAMDRVIGGQK